MPKLSELPLVKVTLRIYAGDKEILDELYPNKRHNLIIRELIHQHIKKVRFVANAKATPRVDEPILDLDAINTGE